MTEENASSAIPVLSTNLRGEITGCNAAAGGAFRCDARELLGKCLPSDATLQNPSDQVRIQKAMLNGLRDEQFDCNVSCVPRRSTQPWNCSLHLFGTVLAYRLGSSRSVLASPRIVKADSGNFNRQLAYENEEESAKTVVREVEGSTFVLASPLMHRFMRMVDRVASHTETVLVTGETGTGKELIARTIHKSSPRRSRPWVDINCAALPENLVESELFGYEKGAFTGADASKPGLFELADRGTLFLDEIGDLQLHTQVKLLRVLDGYPFYRLGGHHKIKVDVRIVAASNQDLEAAVTASRFRHDLFHRLGQFQLRVPPLRERPEDVVALAEHFLALKNSQ